MGFVCRPGGVSTGDDGCFTFSMGSSNRPFRPYSDELGSKAVGRTNLIGGKSHHQRCISECDLEKPAWFDELLNEPETSLLARKGHRRSASDSSAYVSVPAHETRGLNKEKNKLTNFISLEPLNSVLNDEHLKVGEKSLATKICSGIPGGNDVETSSSSSTITEKHDQEECIVSQNKEEASRKTSIPQTKLSLPKGDENRAKQSRQSAHRSRVRKLQYIAELERNIQVLQVEASEFSAALEFLDQQKLILVMENRALQQRLDSLSQEHMIKHMEQEMLEREIVRLRAICELQMQPQPMLPPKKNKNQLNGQLMKPLHYK